MPSPPARTASGKSFHEWGLSTAAANVSGLCARGGGGGGDDGARPFQREPPLPDATDPNALSSAGMTSLLRERPRFIHNGRLLRCTGSVFDKLTDSSLFTGAARARFDNNGRGRGVYGRDNECVTANHSGPVATAARPSGNGRTSEMPPPAAATHRVSAAVRDASTAAHADIFWARGLRSGFYVAPSTAERLSRAGTMAPSGSLAGYVSPSATRVGQPRSHSSGPSASASQQQQQQQHQHYKRGHGSAEEAAAQRVPRFEAWVMGLDGTLVCDEQRTARMQLGPNAPAVPEVEALQWLPADRHPSRGPALETAGHSSFQTARPQEPAQRQSMQSARMELPQQPPWRHQLPTPLFDSHDFLPDSPRSREGDQLYHRALTPSPPAAEQLPSRDPHQYQPRREVQRPLRHAAPAAGPPLAARWTARDDDVEAYLREEREGSEADEPLTDWDPRFGEQTEGTSDAWHDALYPAHARPLFPNHDRNSPQDPSYPHTQKPVLFPAHDELRGGASNRRAFQHDGGREWRDAPQQTLAPVERDYLRQAANDNGFGRARVGYMWLSDSGSNPSHAHRARAPPQSAEEMAEALSRFSR